MISFLFWNTGKNSAALRSVARMASSRAIDVVLLVECPDNVPVLLGELNSSSGSEYLDLTRIPTKIKLLTRLPSTAFAPRFTGQANDLTIWSLRATDPERVLLALVHLPAKAGGVQDTDQAFWAEGIAREIAEIEDDEACLNTILVGERVHWLSCRIARIAVGSFGGSTTRCGACLGIVRLARPAPSSGMLQFPAISIGTCSIKCYCGRRS